MICGLKLSAIFLLMVLSAICILMSLSLIIILHNDDIDKSMYTLILAA